MDVSILIIEDNTVYQEMIKRMLNRLPSITVEGTRTLEHGLAHLRTHPIDVILLDLDLPDSTGLDAIPRLVAEFPKKTLVVLTGLDDETLAVEALAAGAQDYLIKGRVGRRTLMRSVRYAIERKRSQMELELARLELENRVKERTKELNTLNKRLTDELAERDQLERIWRRSNFVVNISKEFMTMIDRNYVYQFANRAYCHAQNLRQEDIVGKSVVEVWGEEAFERVIRNQLDNSFVGDEMTTRDWLTYPMLGKRFMHVTTYPYRNPEGEVIGVVVVSRDATESKLAAEKLENYAERLHLLTRQLIHAQESERERISRELHDEAGQALTALKISLEVIRSELGDCADSLRQRVNESIELAGATMTQVRGMAHNLRPPSLDELGLHRTLQSYCNRTARQTGLQINYQGEQIEDLSGEIQITLYRLIQEAMTNALKHAEASSINVELRKTANSIVVTVEDDGIGFETSADELMNGGKGIGLLGMQERMMAINGALQIHSSKNAGTLVMAQFPWETFAPNALTL